MKVEDLDVVFIDADDVVEVKCTEALWKALEKTSGEYLFKFVRLRGQGAAVGQKREVTMAIRSPETGALDRPLPSKPTRTPRELLSEESLGLEVAP